MSGIYDLKYEHFPLPNDYFDQMMEYHDLLMRMPFSEIVKSLCTSRRVYRVWGNPEHFSS